MSLDKLLDTDYVFCNEEHLADGYSDWSLVPSGENQVKFQLLRKGIVDGIYTIQDITDHQQRIEWSDGVVWEPETPGIRAHFVLRLTRIDSDNEHRFRYYVGYYTNGKWRCSNTNTELDIRCTRLAWKLIDNYEEIRL